jgi:hypothetical protein
MDFGSGYGDRMDIIHDILETPNGDSCRGVSQK